MNESTATRVQRTRRRARVLSLGVGAIWLAVVISTPVGDWIAGWAAEVAGGETFWAAALYASVVAAAWEAMVVPLTGARTAVVATTVAGVAGAVLWSVGAVTPMWWWGWGGVLGGGALVAATLGVGLAQRRSASVLVRRADLALRLDELAVRVCGRRIPILESTGRDADAPSARVTGVGAAGVILLSPRMVADWSPGEVTAVVAHELSHVSRRDLWRKAALDAAVLTAALGVVHLAVPGMGQAGGLAEMPRMAGVGLLVWFACRPIRLAQSRAHERAADRFALEQTGDPGSLSAAVRRLAVLHLAEERPARLTRWFFHRHPTVAERLAFTAGAVPRSDRSDDTVSTP